MRGVLFTGGESPQKHQVIHLLPHIDIFAAADSGLQTAEKWNIHCAWIVGDMDSLDSVERLKSYPFEAIQLHPCDKDHTDTELGINLLYQKGCTEIILIGGGGGRLDHLLGIIYLFERKISPTIWYTANEEVLLLDATIAHSNIQLNIRKGAILSIFPVGRGPHLINSKGLKWPLNSTSWENGFFGLSNIATTEKPVLQVETGRFLIISQLSDFI